MNGSISEQNDNDFGPVDEPDVAVVEPDVAIIEHDEADVEHDEADAEPDDPVDESVEPPIEDIRSCLEAVPGVSPFKRPSKMTPPYIKRKKEQIQQIAGRVLDLSPSQVIILIYICFL